ncbi:methionine ABC transporter ATP-binding protein [Mangrovactinospora gilvigrisea]|uniref:Methionine ABC transporter ATP-binding protein n=1 Tax=Mangrovactinospora gilvigrisea TaxID=1428644 RepID=A0A1J7BG98_9ACTN|nr:ATP-binding cassette domain-containing protein [Mangrovactinospora gilvigrisea]OIV37691.1 methionine ABC transporter ATP-binding protein [Mangrovactinospora gilvigrisea]
MGSEPIICVESLVKEFRRTKQQSGRFSAIRTLLTRERTVSRAVDGISFGIPEGELVGYLGPNGAGKSTTIKILTGILMPTSGTVHVAGIVPWRERKRNAAQIGVVFGQRTQLWWDLPLSDSLELVGRLYEIPPPRFRFNLKLFTELLELGPFLSTPVRQLSLGQRMRGDLAAAMLHSPRILFLDEPTIGLDVVAKERIRSFIYELNKEQGTTVILTTHDLDDVERLCQRVLLITDGSVLFEGDVESLKNMHTRERDLIIRLPPGSESIELANFASARIVDESGDLTRVRFNPQSLPITELVSFLLSKYAIVDFSVKEPELEEVVRNIYAARSL